MVVKEEKREKAISKIIRLYWDGICLMIVYKILNQWLFLFNNQVEAGAVGYQDCSTKVLGSRNALLQIILTYYPD